MSCFREEITLENPRDAGNARHGIIKETEVRHLTVKALVDTGAWTLVISEDTRAKLGLDVLYTDTSEVADGVVVTGLVTEPVNVHWKDRQTGCNAFVLPNETEVLFGALPLEGMDLLVDPKRERVIGAHGDKTLRIVK
ncbi:MAG: retroviral-like aspartic protease family protein [Treponema sp.]|jgi:clan AA aspartic protease|nr:retroviral-like aspartic protease family protein [Treponema sp.]